MKSYQKVAALLAILFFSQSSFAFFDSGNDLAKNMKEMKKYDNGSKDYSRYSVSAYQNYIKGVWDILSYYGVICPSENMTLAQVEAIVAKYVEANPEKWNDPAVELVTNALISTFVCKNK